MNQIDLFKLNSETVHGSIKAGRINRKELSDVIYRIGLKASEQEAFLVLHIEHYSQAEKNISLRQLNYELNALVEYNELNPNKPLPLVVPIIYYQGMRSPFPYSTDVFGLFGAHKAHAKDLLLHPKLIDLQQLSDTKISAHKGIAVAELAFKYAANRQRLDGAKMHMMIDLFQDMNYKLRRVVLEYSVSKIDCNTNEFIDRYLDHLSQDKENVMTMAEQLIQQGVKRYS